MVDFSELFDGEIEEFTKKAKVSESIGDAERVDHFMTLAR